MGMPDAPIKILLVDEIRRLALDLSPTMVRDLGVIFGFAAPHRGI